ncbi:PAS domain-containing protein [Flavobacterium sp. NRK F10]|uniref:PAS domain-containing protein n=1 Tax=Flavobacterium sp. NRK F10 TaxID=2954931 RepID=UPI0020905FDB|nr:PAS domain-containing protein [Flavobacterium sp. NRK F10]MCO6176093.1 PAS domain-containing protein [Flavobacterium sp. NRK F10]
MEAPTRPTPIDKEVIWDKTRTIMSKTDKYGTIEYANEVFVDVCGYEDYELVGQPHNIIRHPDMPKVVFKVLWDNLKLGNNFHAVVKNMAKSGRYYWVITDFDISRNEDGEITHYFARRKAVPQEVVSKIEPLYKKLLQIEEAAGMEGSEKYLTGFLEEQGQDYVEFLKGLMSEYQKEQAAKAAAANAENNKPVESKGFFARFFS